MNDTSASVKLRWEVRVTAVYEAEVPIDQMPDTLIEENDDNTWSIVEGDVDSYTGRDFLEALDIAGSAIEQSTTVEGYSVIDSEHIAPVMVASAPISVIELRYPEESGLAGLNDYERAALVSEASAEVDEIDNTTPCTRIGEHQPDSDHRWQECPVYHGEGMIE